MTTGSSFENNLSVWKIVLPSESFETFFVKAAGFDEAVKIIGESYLDRTPNMDGSFGIELTNWNPMLDSYYH